MFSLSFIVFVISVLACVLIDRKLKNIIKDFIVYLALFILFALIDTLGISPHVTDETEFRLALIEPTENSELADRIIVNYPEFRNEYESLKVKFQEIAEKREKRAIEDREKRKKESNDFLTEKSLELSDMFNEVSENWGDYITARSELVRIQNQIVMKAREDERLKPLARARSIIRAIEICLSLFVICCVPLMVIGKIKPNIKIGDNTFSYLFWNFIVLATYDFIKSRKKT